jgi:hypothetical protein
LAYITPNIYKIRIIHFDAAPAPAKEMMKFLAAPASQNCFFFVYAEAEHLNTVFINVS